MTVVMCCTRNWYFYLYVSLYALFKHNKVEKVYLFIEDDNIPYIKDKRVTFLNINKLKEYVNEMSPNYNTKYSRLSYIRCFFSKYLKESKVIYLDVDALVIDDISELWNENGIVGVHEGGEWEKYLGIENLDSTYINSGVLLLDLDFIRKERLDDKMIYFLNTVKFAFPDQDVINIVLRDYIKHIDNRYNSTETTGFRNDAKIIHYIRERKGWVLNSPRSEIWFQYFNEVINKFKERGGEVMVNCTVIIPVFRYGDFSKIKNLVRADATKNEIGMLYEGDTFTTDYETALWFEEKCPYIQKLKDADPDYKPGKYAFIKHTEIVPEVKEETKEEIKEEPKEEVEEKVEVKKTKTTKKKAKK